MTRKDFVWAGVLLVVVSVAAVIYFSGSTAVGQEQPGGRGGRMGGMSSMMPGSMCAVGNNLFVLKGSTLYKINPDDLSTVKKITFEDTSAQKPPETPDEQPK